MTLDLGDVGRPDLLLTVCNDGRRQRRDGSVKTGSGYDSAMAGLLKQKVTWPTVVLSVALGPALLTLYATGHSEAANAVFLTLIGMSLVGQLHFRMAKQEQRGSVAIAAPVEGGIKTVRFQEAVLLPFDSKSVWELIEPVEKAPLLYPHIRRGYRVPGTPEGLGQQHATEALDGSVTVLEVVEWIPFSRAVAKIVSASSVPTRAFYAVEAMGSGCMYRQGIEFDLPPDRSISPGFEGAWRAEMEDVFARMRKVLTHMPELTQDTLPEIGPTDCSAEKRSSEPLSDQ